MQWLATADLLQAAEDSTSHWGGRRRISASVQVMQLRNRIEAAEAEGVPNWYFNRTKKPDLEKLPVCDNSAPMLGLTARAVQCPVALWKPRVFAPGDGPERVG